MKERPEYLTDIGLNEAIITLYANINAQGGIDIWKLRSAEYCVLGEMMRLREALEFYADKYTTGSGGMEFGKYGGNDCYHGDFGSVAREGLKETK